MTIRDRLEALEECTLSERATFSASDAALRCAPISDDDLRTPFQRDRDRILHSKAFRRLKHKTQCFLAPEGDHYRTRLTHTLEVAQIARTLARSLRLNEDLAEAIALGHDLGHTPFGHMGERILNRLLPDGFRHREQSLRVVSLLEKGGIGLNLTEAVRDGILHHSGDTPPGTLEGQCVAISDRIAYINHDIDDAIRAGVLLESDLPRAPLSVLGETHGERIDRMIRDIVARSEQGGWIRMSDEAWQASQALRAFLMEAVYMRADVQAAEQKADRLITALFQHILAHPETLPGDFRHRAEMDGLQRATTDFLAGMTDRYAVSFFESEFVPL